MKFKTIHSIDLHILPGCDIHQACTEAIQVAFQLHHPVCFEFNSRTIYVVPGDSVNELLDAWHKAVNSVTKALPSGVHSIRTGRVFPERPPEKKKKKPKEEKPWRAPRRIVL